MWEIWRERVARAISTRAKSIGLVGEHRAAVYLRRKLGFKIIARNWRSPRDRRDEIDIVCTDREVLVFVEVKTRSTRSLVSGYHAVNRRKREALQRAIDTYLLELPRAERPRTFRLDVVEVCSQPHPDDADIRHFENVALFGKHYWR
jgi:putative endonuclease